MTFRPCLTAARLPAAFFAACLARAQPTGDLALSTNDTLLGQDQDMLNAAGFATRRSLKPAVQGGLDYAFVDTGWYVGAWAEPLRRAPPAAWDGFTPMPPIPFNSLLLFL
ncbi:TorF family putative porin [Paracidovorax konjaci]|uniref:Uncharacterized protein n=1 Tax=Paracidovorax konjaci TaxID=32040 RepID=A0A1I1Z8F3_9BURK|nr:TorF family putative porin [Paracidovorax konjaci]SFE28031.1 protein of unknown function (Gcw_chp) [Paracidovorax konjaci]